jgi:mannose-6-phosphate isomerase-like protein (cupin superfamily)
MASIREENEMTIINPANIQPRVNQGISARPLLNKDTPTDTLNIGHMTMEPGAQQHPHAHEDEEAWIVLEGSGVVRLGDTDNPISQGMAAHAPAGTVHCFKNTSSTPMVVVFIHAIHSPKTVHF